MEAVLDSAEAGALMFLHKQEFTPELLARMVEAVLEQARVRRHLAALQDRLPENDHLALSGSGPAMKRVAEQIRRAADNPESVILVSGEQGTGHGLVAQAIHDRSRIRVMAPLIMASDVSGSGAHPGKMLFGAPAINGTPRQKGLLEQANGGILFLDRASDFSSEIRRQIADILLNRRLDGGDFPIPLDVQLVAGVLSDTVEETAHSWQREGLGERLIEIYLPPLRDRRGDISLLATAYLHAARQQGKTFARTISRDAIELLDSHVWPGNLTELRSTVEYAAVRAMITGSEKLAAEHLPGTPGQIAGDGPEATDWDYRYHVSLAEVALAERAIRERGAQNKTQLAKLLGYKDRFVFGRRIQKALGEHAAFAAVFPLIARWFPDKSKAV